MSRTPDTVTLTSDLDQEPRASQQGLALRWVFPAPLAATIWPKREVTFGRDDACDVKLDLPQISRRHARFERMGGVWLVRDLQSKNGVRVNGVRVSSQALNPGDVVRIGEAVLVAVQAPIDADLSFRYFAPGLFGGYRHARAFSELLAVARQKLSVVLEGATGTGKERFANALHVQSGREGRFVAVNCAVYVQSNATAELFGYRKGAFTGASDASPGHIRGAERGTLFLDELTELPLEVQPMLLRALENREIIPLGETRARSIDVRFVAAAQTPLSEAVERGRFRADLRARLEQSVIRLPRLAECRELLPEALAVQMKALGAAAVPWSAGFVEQLCMYDFPLNLRELDALARRLVSLSAEGLPLGAETLHRALGTSEPKERDPLATGPPRGSTLLVPGREARPYTAAELHRVREALQRAGGNVAKVASELGISRPRIYRMLKFSAESDDG